LPRPRNGSIEEGFAAEKKRPREIESEGKGETSLEKEVTEVGTIGLTKGERKGKKTPVTAWTTGDEDDIAFHKDTLPREEGTIRLKRQTQTSCLKERKDSSSGPPDPVIVYTNKR